MDRRPNKRNKVSFSNFSGLVWKVPHSTEIQVIHTVHYLNVYQSRQFYYRSDKRTFPAFFIAKSEHEVRTHVDHRSDSWTHMIGCVNDGLECDPSEGSFCRYRSTDYVSLRKTKEIKDRKQNNSK